MSSPVSRLRKETSGWMFDLTRHSVNPLKPCFRVSYGPVAPFSSVTCGVISILVALQARSIRGTDARSEQSQLRCSRTQDQENESATTPKSFRRSLQSRQVADTQRA